MIDIALAFVAGGIVGIWAMSYGVGRSIKDMTDRVDALERARRQRK